MILESITIIIVIVVASLLVLNKGSGYTVGILPLTILPAMHIVGKSLSAPLASMLSILPTTAYIAIDVAALVATCLFVGGISTQIKSKRSRSAYLAMCAIFSTVLCCVLIVNTLIV